MVRGWRARNPAEITSTWRDYFLAVKETAKRPLPFVHAVLAGVTYFGAFFAALGF